MQKTLLSALIPVCLLLVSCATPYVEPPREGNATIRITNSGEVELRTTAVYLNGASCKERLYIADPKLSKYVDSGGAFVVTAEREMAVTMRAVKSVRISFPLVTTEACETGVSFVPQSNAQYKVNLSATNDGCAIQVVRISDAEIGREFTEPTVRIRKPRWPFFDQQAGCD